MGVIYQEGEATAWFRTCFQGLLFNFSSNLAYLPGIEKTSAASGAFPHFGFV